MTKEEFDLLPSDGKMTCPGCGLRGYTTPYPGCGCPTVEVGHGISYVRHINKWHHDCADARRRALDES